VEVEVVVVLEVRKCRYSGCVGANGGRSFNFYFRKF
jgi:hypothetical protein